MEIDRDQFQILVVEFRTFATTTELKLQTIEQKLEKLEKNSTTLGQVIQNAKLVAQDQEYKWIMHHADHEGLTEELETLEGRVTHLWPYILIAIVLGIGSSSLFEYLLPFLSKALP